MEMDDKSDKNDFENIKIVKKYFSRIFTVLKPEIREKLMNLNVSKEKKEIIKKELAFLDEKKQIEYLDELFLIWNRILKGY